MKERSKRLGRLSTDAGRLLRPIWPLVAASSYADLLPALKREGRTLVVISHDDRYFDAADRVVHLDDGRMTEAPGGVPAPVAPSYFGSA